MPPFRVDGHIYDTYSRNIVLLLLKNIPENNPGRYTHEQNNHVHRATAEYVEGERGSLPASVRRRGEGWSPASVRRRGEGWSTS